METTTKLPVSFTQRAINEIKRLMEAPDFDQHQYLRIGVKGGGCSGMTYILNFETKDTESETFLLEGIPCMMNPSHQLYLYGMQVDWEGGLNSRGFTFTNPNASNTCGCGTSFSI